MWRGVSCVVSVVMQYGYDGKWCHTHKKPESNYDASNSYLTLRTKGGFNLTGALIYSLASPRLCLLSTLLRNSVAPNSFTSYLASASPAAVALPPYSHTHHRRIHSPVTTPHLPPQLCHFVLRTSYSHSLPVSLPQSHRPPLNSCFSWDRCDRTQPPVIIPHLPPQLCHFVLRTSYLVLPFPPRSPATKSSLSTTPFIFGGRCGLLGGGLEVDLEVLIG